MDNWELYDLENDPNEMNNIYSNASKDLIDSLKLRLSELKKEYKDDFSIKEMKVMTDTVIQRVYNEPNKLKTKHL
jgi:glutathionyl-hydroquinone reductase